MSDATLDFYDGNAARYSADGHVNPHLAGFLRRCPPGGRILELGSGSGVDAEAMIKAGYAVDATDGSSELAAIAEQRIGRPVRVMRFEDLAAQGTYDGIYASASLLHAPRVALPDIVAKVHAALRPGGVAWASFKAGTAEGHNSLGRYYNYFSAGDLLDCWGTAADWAELSTDAWQGSGFDRQPTDWVAITAVRA